MDMKQQNSRQRWVGCTAVVALAALAARATADEPASADATQTRSTTELHLSKLATTGPKPLPITPPKPAEITAAIQRGIEFLLNDQRPDGCWGSPEKTKGLNLYAPPPGAHDAFRSGVTGLVIMALIESEQQASDQQRPRVSSGDRPRRKMAFRAFAASPPRHARCALQHMGPRLRDPSPGAACTTAQSGDPEHQARLKKLAISQADMLARYSFLAGGWGYYDFDPGSQIPGRFVQQLLHRHRADRATRSQIDRRRVSRAAHQKGRSRRSTASNIPICLRLWRISRAGAGDPDQPAGGSLGRSQVCNLALRLYGDERVTDEVIETWLDRLVARNGWLSMGRKRPIPHESHFYGGRLFLLLRPLVRGAVHRAAAARRAAAISGPSGPRPPAAAGKGRQLVGLSVLQLPPAIRHGDGDDVAGPLPKSNVAAVSF